MEIHTLLNEDALHELRKHLINPGNKKVIYIICVLFLFLSICSFILSIYYLAMIFFDRCRHFYTAN